MSSFWNWLSHTNPDVWAAGAGWTAVIIASGAGIYTRKQVLEARALREEQAQPYVVASMEADPGDPRIVDLVVRNYGATAALNVEIEMTPTPQRASFADLPSNDVWLFERLPVLAPGQEWRTFWDLTDAHLQSDLPQQHHVVVKYANSHGKQQSAASDLNWAAYSGRRWVARYGLHEIGKSLEKIENTMRPWNEGYPGGLRVTVRNGDAKDALFEAEKQTALAELRRPEPAPSPARKGPLLRRALRRAVRIVLRGQPRT